MKLPIQLEKLFNRTPEKKELYLSLLLSSDHVAGAVWFLDAKGKPELTHAVARRMNADTWDERAVAADQVIGALEERTGTQDIHNVILGLPTGFLSESGDIRQDIRAHLKKFSAQLSLNPIGFVPVHQAIAYKLKHEEGVPPSVILIGITRKDVAVSVYKVGKVIGQERVPLDARIIQHIERVLKECAGEEVLPSRMILYGIDTKRLDAVKAEMTRYPWPTKVNFLHFPKIDILSADTAVLSISLAGASELRQSVPVAAARPADAAADTKEEQVRPQPAAVPAAVAAIEDEAEDVPDVSDTEEPQNEEEETVIAHPPAASRKDPDEVPEKESLASHVSEPEFAVEDVSNVRYVPPESVGFHRGTDVLEKQPEPPPQRHQEVRHPGTVHAPKHAVVDAEPEFGDDADEETSGPSRGRKFPGLPVLGALFGSVGKLGSGIMGRGKIAVVIGVVLIVAAALLGYLAYGFPSATIDVVLNTEPVNETATVTIDPEATAVDATEKIIPGKKQEISVSGDKTVPATGKKEVGDPAKGKVTIYNKSLSSRTFKKGSVILDGKLEFKLDDDVSVASASESIGSLTFGKADVAVTAADIGTDGNVPAGTEFTFQDVSSSVAIARNENAFSGGTSKSIVVVSRADYDALVKAVTDDLVNKAKQQLSDSVGGSQKLIDGTITTEVAEKTFKEEIEQQANQVHGTVKVTVSGVSYDEADISTLFSEMVQSKVPDGYVLNSKSLKTSMADLTVQKDGKITGDVTVEAEADPQFEPSKIGTTVAGKRVSQAEDAIRQLTGVDNVHVSVRNILFANTLPMRSNRITVHVETK